MSTETKIYNELIGKVFSDVRVENDDSELIFETESGDKYVFYHSQDCCESVGIKEIVGELSDLIGSPILKAEEIINENKFEVASKYPSSYKYGYDSVTWTFYKFATIKGYADVSWIGESNGYYSESVDFKIETKEKEQEREDKRLKNLLNHKDVMLKDAKLSAQAQIQFRSEINHSLGQILDFLQDKNSNNDLISVKHAVEDLYNKTEIRKTFITGNGF